MLVILWDFKSFLCKDIMIIAYLGVKMIAKNWNLDYLKNYRIYCILIIIYYIFNMYICIFLFVVSIYWGLLLNFNVCLLY